MASGMTGRLSHVGAESKQDVGRVPARRESIREQMGPLPARWGSVQPEIGAVADADLRRPRSEHSCKQLPRFPWPDQAIFAAGTRSGQGAESTRLQGLRRGPNVATMVPMVARLRIVLFAVAVLALARVAYAQNIHIEIQGDPWKASPSEERQQYLRGREADKMSRRGYVCYPEVGTVPGCTWAKPERERTERVKAHWGECYPADLGIKGRICRRITPDYSAWYCSRRRQ